jgi:hypothetical protein
MILTGFTMVQEPREPEVIRAELFAMAGVTEPNGEFCKLLDELENRAWAAGMDEGYDHGYYQAREDL